MVEAAENYMAIADPETCPLFNSLLDKIALDHGEQHSVSDPHWKKELFESVRDVYARKQSRVPGTRWFSFVDCATDFLPKWHTKLLLLYYHLLQAGLLDQSSTVGLLQEAASRPHEQEPAEGVPEEAAATGRESVSERDLRRRAGNQLQLQAVVMSGGDTCAIVKCCVAALSETRLFHGIQNKHNRSCKAVQTWYAEQAVGKGLPHLIATVAKVSDWKTLETIGFWMPGGSRPAGADNVGDQMHPWLAHQNDLAQHFGGLVVRVVGRRLTTLAWHDRNLLGKLAGLLIPEERPAVLDWIRRSDEAWRAAEAQPDSWWRDAKRRSSWEMLVVQKAFVSLA
jgi:hypothetical protein